MLNIIVPCCEKELRILDSIGGKSALWHIAQNDANIIIVVLPKHLQAVQTFIELNSLANVQAISYSKENGNLRPCFHALACIDNDYPVILQWADLLVSSYKPMLEQFPCIGLQSNNSSSSWNYDSEKLWLAKNPKMPAIGVFSFANADNCFEHLYKLNKADIAEVFQSKPACGAEVDLLDFGTEEQKQLLNNAPKGTAIAFEQDRAIKQSSLAEIHWLNCFRQWAVPFERLNNCSIAMPKLKQCTASMHQLIKFASAFLGPPKLAPKLDYIAKYADAKAIARHYAFNYFANKSESRWVPERSHGDITPMNVLQDDNGKLFLIDPRLPLELWPYEFELGKIVHGFFWQACLEHSACKLTLQELKTLPAGVLAWAGLQSLATPSYFKQDWHRYCNALCQQETWLELLREAMI